MIELIITSVVSATAFSALVTGGVQFFINRQNSKIEERMALPAPISQEMRDEIEQNEAWWLRSFHEQMLKAGAAVVAKIHGTEWSERKYVGKGRRQTSHVIFHRNPDRVSLEGCICPECAEVLVIAGQNEREQAELESRAAKARAEEDRERRVVAELQANLGVQADGIMGPATLRAIQLGCGNSRYLSPEAYEMLHEIRHFRPTLPLPSNVTQMSRGGVTWQNGSGYTAVQHPGLCAFEWESNGHPRMCMNSKGHGGRHQDGMAWVMVGSEHMVRQPRDMQREVEYWKSLGRA